VVFKVARPRAFSCKAVLSLVKCAHACRQGNKETKIRLSHSKYASYTWVIPHKPTVRAIQKDVFDRKTIAKRGGRYGAYRK